MNKKINEINKLKKELLKIYLSENKNHHLNIIRIEEIISSIHKIKKEYTEANSKFEDIFNHLLKTSLSAIQREKSNEFFGETTYLTDSFSTRYFEIHRETSKDFEKLAKLFKNLENNVDFHTS